MALVTEKTSQRSRLRCRNGILLLVFVAMRDAVVVFPEHLALLEGVVDRALVLRTRLLNHVVEQAATASRGASRSFAVWGGNEGLLRVLYLP